MNSIPDKTMTSFQSQKKKKAKELVSCVNWNFTYFYLCPLLFFVFNWGTTKKQLASTSSFLQKIYSFILIRSSVRILQDVQAINFFSYKTYFSPLIISLAF